LILSVCDDGSEIDQIVDLDSLFDDQPSGDAICGDGHYAIALRLSEVRGLFDKVQNDMKSLSHELNPEKKPYEILNFTGETLIGSPLILDENEMCWTVKPDHDGRVIIDYKLSSDVSLTSVVILGCQESNNIKGAEIRGGISSNTTDSFRYCPYNTSPMECRVGTRKAEAIRVIVAPQNSESGLAIDKIVLKTKSND